MLGNFLEIENLFTVIVNVRCAELHNDIGKIDTSGDGIDSRVPVWGLFICGAIRVYDNLLEWAESPTDRNHEGWVDSHEYDEIVP